METIQKNKCNLKDHIFDIQHGEPFNLETGGGTYKITRLKCSCGKVSESDYLMIEKIEAKVDKNDN